MSVVSDDLLSEVRGKFYKVCIGYASHFSGPETGMAKHDAYFTEIVYKQQS